MAQINALLKNYSLIKHPPSPFQIGARIAVLSEDNIWAEGEIINERTAEDDELAVTILYDGPDDKNPSEGAEAREEFLERDNTKYKVLLKPEGPNLAPAWDKRLLKSWKWDPETKEGGALFTSLGMQGPKGPQVMISRIGPETANDVYEGKPQQGLVKLESGVQILEIPFSGIYRVQAAGARGYWGQASIVEGTFQWNGGDKIKIIVGQKYGGATWIYVNEDDEKPLLVAAGGGMRGNGKAPGSLMDYSGSGGEGKHPYGCGAGWNEPGVGEWSGQPPKQGAEGGGSGGFGGGGDACGAGFNGGYDQQGGWSFLDEDRAIDADSDWMTQKYNMRNGYVKIYIKEANYRARHNPLVDVEKKIPEAVERPEPPPIEYMTWKGPKLWDGQVDKAAIQVRERPEEKAEFEVDDECTRKLSKLHSSLCDSYPVPDDEFRIAQTTGIRWLRKLINFDDEMVLSLDDAEGEWEDLTAGAVQDMPKNEFVEFGEVCLRNFMQGMDAGQVSERISSMIDALQNEEEFENEIEETWPDNKYTVLRRDESADAAQDDDAGDDAVVENDYEDDAYEDGGGGGGAEDEDGGDEDEYENDDADEDGGNQEFPQDAADDYEAEEHEEGSYDQEDDGGAYDQEEEGYEDEEAAGYEHEDENYEDAGAEEAEEGAGYEDEEEPDADAQEDVGDAYDSEDGGEDGGEDAYSEGGGGEDGAEDAYSEG